MSGDVAARSLLFGQLAAMDGARQCSRSFGCSGVEFPVLWDRPMALQVFAYMSRLIFTRNQWLYKSTLGVFTD